MTDEKEFAARLDKLDARLCRLEKRVHYLRFGCEYSEPTKPNETQAAGAFEILNPARKIKNGTQ